MLLKSNLFRLFFSFCFILSLAIFAFADTIRLKDGSIIKGKIISFGGGIFTVVVGDDSRQRQMTFRADEIDSIKFENGVEIINAVKASDPYKVNPPTVQKENNSTVITAGNGSQVNTPPVIKQSETKPAAPPPVIKEAPKQTMPAPVPAPVHAPAPVTTSPPVSAPTTSNIKPIELNVKVLADNTSNGWTNSGWVVRKGQKIRVTSSGRISLGGGRYSTPSGIVSLPDNDKLIKDQATGSLIAVIGDDNNDFIFIGADNEFIATRDGALFLGVNEGNLNDNSGSFDVKVQITPIIN